MYKRQPLQKADDERVIQDLMKQEGKKVVCGGTSANIAARVLKKDIVTSIDYADPSVDVYKRQACRSFLLRYIQ